MTKKNLDWWCCRAWVKFGFALTLVITIAALINWERWSDEVKILASVAALIPVHVIEEWVFPGGFHYHYNLLMKSKEPNSTPMCRLSDMFTNLLTTVMYALLTIYCLIRGSVPAGLLLATLCFSALEVFAHTLFGTLMYFRFRDKGKTTIYGPGSITAYLGFGVIGTLSWYSIRSIQIQGSDIALCLIVLGIILFLFILIPENVIKRVKKTPYAFESAGYYQRFL